MRRAIEWAATINSLEMRDWLNCLLSNMSITLWLHSLILLDAKAVHDGLTKRLLKKADPLLAKVITLLDSSAAAAPAVAGDVTMSVSEIIGDPGLRVVRAVKNANSLSLPFCQMQLLLVFEAVADEESRKRLLRNVFYQVERNSTLESAVVGDLVRPLDDSVLKNVRISLPLLTECGQLQQVD
jgi:hypothetical protein